MLTMNMLFSGEKKQLITMKQLKFYFQLLLPFQSMESIGAKSICKTANSNEMLILLLLLNLQLEIYNEIRTHTQHKERN